MAGAGFVFISSLATDEDEEEEGSSGTPSTPLAPVSSSRDNVRQREAGVVDAPAAVVEMDDEGKWASPLVRQCGTKV